MQKGRVQWLSVPFEIWNEPWAMFACLSKPPCTFTYPAKQCMGKGFGDLHWSSSLCASDSFVTSLRRMPGSHLRLTLCILTGLFESKFLLGGGGGGQFDPPPLQISARSRADRRKILQGCQDTCKEYRYDLFLAENSLFIMLLWFMQIRCIIITYLLIFPTIYLKANFWQKVL